jgi:hypothetical protein
MNPHHHAGADDEHEGKDKAPAAERPGALAEQLAF